MMNLKKKFFKRFDIPLFIAVISLCIYGVLVIMSATASYENPRFIKVQIITIFIGVLGVFFLASMDYRTLEKFYISIYVFSNLLLIAVLLFGTGDESWGARRWFKIGSLKFQPSEIVKIGLIISFAKIIEENKNNLNEPITLLKILLFAAIPIGLILLQPDCGTAAVFMFFILAMLFAAGLDLKYFKYAFIIGILSLPIIWFSLDNLRKKRIFVFLNPEQDVSDSAYQAMQAKIAVGSGKLFGRGLCKGVQTQFGYLPEKQNDLIFAVIGEELGLIGGLILLALYFIVLYRLIKIAKDTKDTFGSLITIGISAMLAIHVWQNIGMVMGLMPITGIPLPFVSYGGTSLLSNMMCIGIALSVGMKKDGLKF